MKPEEIEKIWEAITKAYKAAGKDITHAMYVEDINEKGEVKGKVLVDKADKN